jgi:uncharacterized membrane protein
MMSKSRFEAFTDGVFAIAITLLVLEIHVPDLSSVRSQKMFAWFWQVAPSISAYVLSFLTIGVIWLNHHAMYTQIKHVDRTVNLLNLFLLMTVCFVPFPTALLARYGPMPETAAFYGIAFFLMGVSYAGLKECSIRFQCSLDPTHPRITWPLRLRGTVGTLFYLLGAILALWAPRIAVGIYVLITIYYLLPGLFGVREPSKADAPIG